MNIYILLPKNENNDVWKPWYDKCFGQIIRARNAKEARQIATSNCGDEGEKAWLNTSLTMCKKLSIKGKSGLVMRDFHSA